MRFASFLLLLSLQPYPALAGATDARSATNGFHAVADDVDNDGDGWTVAQGDCCDVATASCPEPALVNPGAFEVPGNGIDDDCNGVIDDPGVVCDALLPSNSTDPFQFARSIDLCQTTTETPPIAQRLWGVINAQLLLADGTGSPAAGSRSIRQSFGSANIPQFGVSLSVLSTGRAAAPLQTNPSFAAFQGGQVMATQSAFPADWLAANGNALPVAPGCPNAQGAVAYDPVMLKLRIRVPTNARSFSVSTRFFGADYPEYVCSPYNDYYLVLLDSTFAKSPANPADKNIAKYQAPNNGGVYLIGSGLAHGNSVLFQACKNGATGCATLNGAVAGTTSSCTGTTDLNGTGFETANPPPQFATDPGYCGANNLLGGGTAWLTTTGNVVPGETIELRFVIWDTGDGYYDSVALLDNFQWSVGLTTPGTFLVGEVPPPQIPPPPPTGIVATAKSSTSVKVEWNAASSATSYQVLRRGFGESFGEVGTVTGLSYTDTKVTAEKAYLYLVRAINDAGASDDSAFDIATTVVFPDDPLDDGATQIRATHLSALRTATTAVHELAGLDTPKFTDEASADVPVKAVHFAEIRSALDMALKEIGLPYGGYIDPTLTDVAIKAVHSQEIRDRIQ